MVLDINPGASSSNPWSMVSIGRTAYFAADDGVHGVELWKSDGTAAGTVMVKDILPGAAGFIPSFLTNVDGTLFFAGRTSSTATGLWKSDGTADGTVMVKDIDSDAFPSYLTNVDGTLFFSAYNDQHGKELWKSDGTAAGTTLVRDILPGGESGYYGGYTPNGSYPMDLTNVDGTLFFSALDGVTGYPALWKSDGTAAGTVLVKDIRCNGLGNLGPMFANVNGTLFLQADDGVRGPELWKSDGTAAGTVLVKDIYTGVSGSYPGSLTNVDGALYFSGRDSSRGWELWKSDGTAAGTILVKDINAGGGSSYPSGLEDINGTIFFSADDAATGAELWKSDGTAAGTVRVADINTGGAGSSPTFLTNAGGALFFAADDGTHGSELWVLVDDATGSSLTLSVGDARVTEGQTGTRAATFTVTLSAASTLPVTVGYATSNGTALAPSDYQATSGNITFAPGETRKIVTIAIKGDRLGELDETFFTNLTAAKNATVLDGQGVGTIVDDEPRVTINDVVRAEGDLGTTAFVFTVSLSAPYDTPVTVRFATSDGTAKTGDNDYSASSGSLTFAAGQTRKSVTIRVRGERRKESNETFFVNLIGASNALILDSQGVGTILNDDDGEVLLNSGDLKGIRRSARRLIS